MIKGIFLKRTLLLIILWCAFAFRVTSLSTAPGLSGDESFNGADAVEVLSGERRIFFTDNYGREPLFIYSIAATMHLAGESIFAIRLTSVFYGMMSLVMAYVLTKRLWNDKVALLTSALISVSFWPLLISRIGLRAVTLPPLQCFTIYSLYRGIKTKRKLWVYLSGVGLGLCTYTYIPGRIFPLIPVLWLWAMLVTKSSELIENIKHLKRTIFICFLVAFTVFMPLGLYMVNHPEMANQRIKNLDWTLDQIKQGNFLPLQNNAILLLKMFFIQGDTDVYYNIPFRPIFGYSLGILFFAGVFICILSLRKPEFQLMILWLGVMLMPSLLSTGGAIMRSVGAMMPIYILPSVTIYFSLNGLPSKLNKFKNPLFYGLMALVLGTVGFRTQHAFFTVWTQLPRVREIYGAGLSQIGQAMTTMITQPEQQIVMVGCEYAADFCRDMVKFQTKYDGPIHWFKSSEALVLPNIIDPSQTIYYFIVDQFPLPDGVNNILSKAHLVKRYISPDGIVEGEIYQMNYPISDIVTPQYSIDGRFRDAMQLIGYDIPQQAYRGSEFEYMLYWKVPETFDKDNLEPPRWLALLTNGEGDYWSKIGGILPYSIWDWSPGEVVIQNIRQIVPVNVPQGYWYPEISIFRQYGGTLVYIDQNGNPSRYLTLNPVRIMGNPTEPIDSVTVPVGKNLEIGVIGLESTAEISAGSTLLTTVDWQIFAKTDLDYQIHFSLHNDSCESASILSLRQELVPDYPTSLWSAGEPVKAFYRFKTDPSIENGYYLFNIELIWEGQSEEEYKQQLICQPLTISGRSHTFDIPAMDVTTQTPFSQGVILLGYSVANQDYKVKRGETLEITLYWQPNVTPLEEYVVFMHIYNDSEKSEIISQHDSLPCYGACPTSSWISEEILVDRHQVTIPVDTLPGMYPIGIGMYQTETFERLEIPNHPDNVFMLEPIMID